MEGPRHLYQSICKCTEDNPRAGRATIVGGALFGEVDFDASLKALVAELGIEDSVTFTGHVEDVYPYLESADVLVHSSVLPEPFGSVVLRVWRRGAQWLQQMLVVPPRLLPLELMDYWFHVATKGYGRCLAEVGS